MDINDLFDLHKDTKFNKLSKVEDLELLNEIKELTTMYALDHLNKLNDTIAIKKLGLVSLITDQNDKTKVERIESKICGINLTQEEIRRLINDIKLANE